MAKSSRKSKEAKLTESNPATSEPQIQTGNGAKAEKEPVAKGAAKKPSKASAKSAGKSRSTAPRKSATPRKPRATRPVNSTATKVAISDDDIRMRAYFIAERRVQEGLPGDSARDWLEARRQLQEEARARA